MSVLFLACWVSLGWTGSWERIKKEAKNIRSLSAGFIQKKQMKILVKPLVSRGVLYFQSPDSLRWEYESPIQSILIAHQGTISRYFKRDNTIIKDSGTNLQVMQFVILEIRRWLNGSFSESPYFAATLKKGGRIVLVPRKKAFSEMINRIELVLSEKPGMIKSIVIYESEDSFTQLEFRAAKLNEMIKGSLFEEIR